MYAASSAWVFGVAAVALFGCALFKPEYEWGDWSGLGLAVLMLIAPFALGFVPVLGAAYSHWLLGALIAVDSIWALCEMRRKEQGMA